MNNIICLDKNYSTTRLITKEKPETLNNLNNKFKSCLFFPVSEGRVAEGGLRGKGYFKKSYNDKPLITIIMVVFNSVDYLEESILSVINQTYQNLEIIITDNGSTDGTKEIIGEYLSDPRIIFLDYPANEKASILQNKANTLSSGKYIGIIYGDDYYLYFRNT